MAKKKTRKKQGKKAEAGGTTSQVVTIGRIVLYDDLPTVDQPVAQTFAALVSEVDPASKEGPASAAPSVSLIVFMPRVIQYRYHVPYDAATKPGTWRWPTRV